jgi:hypothetical protein
VRHAESAKNAPPQLLNLYWQCQNWRSLPRAGGVLDQPAGLLRKMRYLERIYTAWYTWRQRKKGKDAAWKIRNESLVPIVEYIQKLKVLYG